VASVPGKLARATVSVGGRVAKATAPSVLVCGEKAVVEAVEAGGKGSARAVAHVVEEVPIRLPPPRPPRPPIGVPMTAAMRAHLLAEIGSVVGQVVAPDLGIGDVSTAPGKEDDDDVLLPGAIGVIALYVLGKRYNLF
jgi:hypothetical protein